MTNYYEYCEMIEEEGVTPKILGELIEAHQSSLGNKAISLYGRYVQSKEALPVFYDRTFTGEAQNKINNHIPNDYFSEIVNTKTGYMFGKPINISYSDSNDVIEEAIKNFSIENNLADLNSEVCTMSAIAGYDTLLIYNDENAKEKLIRLDPWEAVVISKTNITEPFAGINYYQDWKKRYVIEYYDKVGKRVFVGSKSFSDTAEDESKFVPNVFGECQMVGVPNNTQLQGDAEKVLNLIDGYDNAFSNAFDELDQFRQAYLLFVGYEPTAEMISDMIKTGALYIPTAENGEKIEWLTKRLDPTFMKEVLDRTEANITRFASHVNFTDAAFGRDITGPAMRYKLFSLETKSVTFERKHQAALRHVFKCLGNVLGIKGTKLDYRKVEFTYNRNIPVNLLDEAQTALALMGVTSHETALSTLSVVGNDAKSEMKLIEQEKAKFGDGEGLDLDNVEEKVEVVDVE